MFQNLVLTKPEKDELQRMMKGFIRGLPPHHHTKNLNMSLLYMKTKIITDAAGNSLNQSFI